MALGDGRAYATFGVSGGYMQPQGHLQLLVNLLDYRMDVQTAIDDARFWWEEGRLVARRGGRAGALYAGAGRSGVTR